MLVNKLMFNKPLFKLQIILVCKLFSFWIVILLYFGKTCGLQKRKQIFQPSEWNSPPHIFSLPPEKQFTMWAVHNSYKTVIGRIWLNSSTQMKIGLGVINCNICIGSTYDCLKFPFNLDSFWMNREDGGFLEIKLLNKYGYKCFHLHLAASYRFPLECPGVEIYSEIMWDHKLKVVEIVIDCMLSTNTFGR